MVKVQEIDSDYINTGFMCGKRMPVISKFINNEIIKRKIINKFTGDQEYIKITDYEYAYQWNGKPQFCSNYA